MAPPRKRTQAEMEEADTPKETSLIEKIRNMWEFACVMQYIFIFGKAVKIDEDFDIEDFETECLKPGSSEKIENVGLTLLKWISSHRGLNFEIWDEYTRRQYLSKAPHLNPYGTEEEPKKFREFDIFQRIRVLHQLTVWTLWNPDRMREKMPEQKDNEQLDWRIDEIGYDRDERLYYVLDDNRLYRRTDPPIPPPSPKSRTKPKANTIKALAARRRALKRRRIDDSETPDPPTATDAEQERDGDTPEQGANGQTETDTNQGFKWELVAITLPQYQEFCESLRKSRDVDEKNLRERLMETVVPIIEKAEESQKRKIERRERELLTLEKMALAKRSSRLADRQERERHDREAADAERRHAADLAAARKEQARQEKMEQDRESRMMTREQRIRDREFKRILHEEELAKIAEEAKKVEAGVSRGSERQLKEKLEKTKRDLEELSAEEEWTFDCSGCGVHGKNIDDGSHSVECEKCNVWQHSKCLGIPTGAAEKDDFHFVCRDCKQKEEDAKKPKISLKFRAGLSSSPPAPRTAARVSLSPVHQPFVDVKIPNQQSSARPPSQGHTANGHPQRDFSSTAPAPQCLPRQQMANGYHPMPTPYHPHAPYPPNGYQTSFNPPTAPAYYQGTQMQNGSGARPTSSSSQQPQALFSPQQYNPAAHNSQQQSHPRQYPPYYNNTPHQYPNYPVAPRQSPPQASPLQSHPQPTFYPQKSSPGIPVRQSSPIANRPIMSPTQGNYEVSRLAGVPQQSPSAPPTYHPALFAATPQNHYRPSQTPANGTYDYTQPPQPHMSGLSPTKHSPPSLPPPLAASNDHQQPSTSPQPPKSTSRSVSGTPIFPPSEKLAPSPQQLSKTVVPTPSKQPSPAQIGDQEMERVNTEVERQIGAHITHIDMNVPNAAERRKED